MSRAGHREKADLDDRKVVYLEFAAASAILTVIAFVVYLVFSYRPG